MSSDDPPVPGGGSPPQSAVATPSAPSEARAWLLAGGLCLLGALALAASLSGLLGRAPAVAPPPVPVVAATPAPAAGAPAEAAARRGQGTLQSAALDATTTPIARSWMEGFYPIYATAQRTFGVNWLLLASIHRQESAFSTAPGTYHGLNFAHCCGGPMQFNVRNGRVSTWDLVSDSYRYGRRPQAYDHMTRAHPSIYDDFDAIMAAAHLLSADGAGLTLDGSAWSAAYDYYGHDLYGIVYADQVLARAISWSQHGFCINCGVEASMVDAVDAAYGAPVRAALPVAAPHRTHRRAAHAVAARRRH